MNAKPLMRQLLLAVKCMHSVGIVHRDINPSNVFIHFRPASSQMMERRFAISEENDETPSNI